MKKTALFCANGFEECEGLIVVDLLRRANIDIKMVSLEKTLLVTGSHGIKIECDNLFDEINFDELDMLILPGGMPGTLALKAHTALNQKILEFDKANKKLAAICAAPSVLGSLNLLNGKKMTCYPGFEEECTGAIYTHQKVEKDHNTITSSGLGGAIDFAATIIEELMNKEEADEVLSAIQYK